jgi:hypothetical protein
MAHLRCYQVHCPGPMPAWAGPGCGEAARPPRVVRALITSQHARRSRLTVGWSPGAAGNPTNTHTLFPADHGHANRLTARLPSVRKGVQPTAQPGPIRSGIGWRDGHAFFRLLLQVLKPRSSGRAATGSPDHAGRSSDSRRSALLHAQSCGQGPQGVLSGCRACASSWHDRSTTLTATAIPLSGGGIAGGRGMIGE